MAQDDDTGAFRFATATEAAEWLALDPHDDPGDAPGRWHFGAVRPKHVSGLTLLP